MSRVAEAIGVARRVFGFRRPADPTGGHGRLDGRVKQVRRRVTDPAECDFYHVVELPGGELTKAQWDLRETADQYLGGVDFAGKRVLEIGPASGFLSFHMERRGARVFCVEPPMDAFWDLVPWPDAGATQQGFAAHIARIRNSFWYLHGLYRSKVECYEADLYNLPSGLPRFDTAVFGSVLLHCCSPVKMLQAVGNLVDGQIVVTERFFAELADQPVCRLLPSRENGVRETWWEFSPLFFQQYLGIIGFPRCTVTRHRQWYAAGDSWIDMFTIVASR